MTIQREREREREREIDRERERERALAFGVCTAHYFDTKHITRRYRGVHLSIDMRIIPRSIYHIIFAKTAAIRFLIDRKMSDWVQAN